MTSHLPDPIVRVEQIRAALSTCYTHHNHIMKLSKELSNESSIGKCQCLYENVSAESRWIHTFFQIFQFQVGCSYTFPFFQTLCLISQQSAN
jgi:hypothetical protein